MLIKNCSLVQLKAELSILTIYQFLFFTRNLTSEKEKILRPSMLYFVLDIRFLWHCSRNADNHTYILCYVAEFLEGAIKYSPHNLPILGVLVTEINRSTIIKCQRIMMLIWHVLLFSDFLFKFLVIGNAGTGKSCLLHQFIEKKCEYNVGTCHCFFFRS